MAALWVNRLGWRQTNARPSLCLSLAHIQLVFCSSALALSVQTPHWVFLYPPQVKLQFGLIHEQTNVGPAPVLRCGFGFFYYFVHHMMSKTGQSKSICPVNMRSKYKINVNRRSTNQTWTEGFGTARFQKQCDSVKHGFIQRQLLFSFSSFQ